MAGRYRHSIIFTTFCIDCLSGIVVITRATKRSQSRGTSVLCAWQTANFLVISSRSNLARLDYCKPPTAGVRSPLLATASRDSGDVQKCCPTRFTTANLKDCTVYTDITVSSLPLINFPTQTVGQSAQTTAFSASPDLRATLLQRIPTRQSSRRWL
jgi:hypothetical protein